MRSVALVLAAGCGLGSAPSIAQAELKVAVTIKPIHALVAGVMEGLGAPDLIVTGTASPHTFALKPSGARALNSANVVFRVSPAVEPFTVKISAGLPRSVRLVTLSETQGLTLLKARQGETFSLGGDGPDADHAHDHADHDHDHSDGAVDGHVWLDTENAKTMVREIARVLAEVSPADAEKLQANATKVIDGLTQLDADLTAQLSPVAATPYVVFHDAYHYFERRYRLSPVGAITLRPDVQPGARRLAELRRKVHDVKAVCAFAEPQFSSSVVRAVTDGTPVRFGTLDPEGALVEPGPDAYLALMRNLASNLRGCLDPTQASGG